MLEDRIDNLPFFNELTQEELDNLMYSVFKSVQDGNSVLIIIRDPYIEELLNLGRVLDDKCELNLNNLRVGSTPLETR